MRIRYVTPRSSSQPRVSWISGSPARRARVWRSISNAIARSTERNEFMFLTSTRVPNASVPTGRSETFASTRIWPFSSAASDAPIVTSSSRSSSAYRRACSPVRTTGSVTISISGVPERLKSTRLTARPSASVRCWRRAVSSSRCARVMATVNGPSDVSKVSEPPEHQRQVVLADLVALGQVRVEVVLAVPAGDVQQPAADGHAGRQHMAHGQLVDDRQRTRQPQAGRDSSGCSAAPPGSPWSSRRTSCSRSSAGHGTRCR